MELVDREKKISLGFHYHCPAILSDGKIFIDGPIGLFLDSISIYFSTIYLFLGTPGKGEPRTFDYQITSENIQLIQIGEKKGLFLRLLRYRRFRKEINKMKTDLDYFLVRVPTPYLPNLFSTLKGLKIPGAIYMVGENLVGIKSMRVNPISKSILWTYYNWYERKLDQSLGYFAGITNSELLVSKFRAKSIALELIKSTTLRNSQISNSPIEKPAMPLKILYAGRIDYSKGLDTILKACIILKDELDIECEFHCVGPTYKGGETYLKTLRETAEENGFGQNFKYLGYKKAGSSELFTVFKEADFFCIGSRSDFEGFPRVIWEALNFGLPVIARPKGSIPYFLDHSENAILIQKDDPQAFADNIQEIFLNDELRDRLIKNGRELVKENTLEKLGLKMADTIYSHFDNA